MTTAAGQLNVEDELRVWRDVAVANFINLRAQ